MIEKFNNIFYLIIYLVHFAGTGIYAFQTIVGTKRFMKKFEIDKSGAVAVRFAGAFLLAVFLMSIYVGFVRPGGLNATWAFFNIVFINNLFSSFCRNRDVRLPNNYRYKKIYEKIWN